MSISALDKDTVKLISTTQVITSVSNAAKELIENALDADAKNIEINLVDNGAALIEVKDDGCGISKIDAPYMALSSYTSKILNFSDLESLETYGFRGEALYALCAVSDLTIITKTKEDEAAMSYIIDRSGHIMKSESCHRAQGTTVQVRQLFKDIPVRRQLITNSKKANQDIKILETFIKSYGICKFDVRISYKVDSNIIFAKPRMATLEEAVTYILSKKVTSNMTWIDMKNAEIHMKLMVPLKNTQNISDVFLPGAQYIFVNNRPIKHKDLEKIMIKTIQEGLGLDLSSRKKPVFLLYILTDAGNIDVNLDPNKTSIFFKDQQSVLNTVDNFLKDFYGIQNETQTPNICDKSINEYQDCTQEGNDTDIQNEWPACKKRKLEKTVEKMIEKDIHPLQESNEENLNSVKDSNLNCNKPESILQHEQIDHHKDDKSKQNVEDLNIHLPSLNLSDSESNDSQNFTVVGNTDTSLNLTNADMQSNKDDSPPFEASQSQTLSQLPVVDLGEDFDWDNSSANINEKENKEENANVQDKTKSDKKKMVSLDEWSKGHIHGIKGGTDIQSYIDPESHESLKDESYHGNDCGGFLKFSKQHRQQVIKQNPTMTAPQIAEVLTNHWKKLSPEERGYYRDLARDEKLERDTSKREAKEKNVTDSKKTKSRLIKMLEKMKTINPDKKGNLLLRTIVSWDMDLKRVTEGFHVNTVCKNDNLVVGLLCPNFWIVHKSAHIWILDATRLKKELNVPNTNADQETAESIEKLLKQWFSMKDDLSLLHPIHSLTQNWNDS
ncbi:uncharacterized protein LOC143185006 [Calliopsis andreniformis]|uniref:uncharacterized protein LOC143185006 n=1 Tax=Calliopsis andreniformis TaxID=337506 RepID=UPI003FCC98B1